MPHATGRCPGRGQAGDVDGTRGLPHVATRCGESRRAAGEVGASAVERPPAARRRAAGGRSRPSARSTQARPGAALEPGSAPAAGARQPGVARARSSSERARRRDVELERGPARAPRRGTVLRRSVGHRPVTPSAAAVQRPLAPGVARAGRRGPRQPATSRRRWSTLARTSSAEQEGVERGQRRAAVPGVGVEAGAAARATMSCACSSWCAGRRRGRPRQRLATALEVEDQPVVEHHQQPGRARGGDRARGRRLRGLRRRSWGALLTLSARGS